MFYKKKKKNENSATENRLKIFKQIVKKYSRRRKNLKRNFDFTFFL